MVTAQSFARRGGKLAPRTMRASRLSRHAASHLSTLSPTTRHTHTALYYLDADLVVPLALDDVVEEDDVLGDGSERLDPAVGLVLLHYEAQAVGFEAEDTLAVGGAQALEALDDREQLLTLLVAEAALEAHRLEVAVWLWFGAKNASKGFS